MRYRLNKKLFLCVLFIVFALFTTEIFQVLQEGVIWILLLLFLIMVQKTQA